MHQPDYINPLSGLVELPWVRLHALKDYFGMVHLLSEFPSVKLNFNLVPVLLQQLEACRAGQTDPYLDLFLKEAAALTGAECDFLVKRFFAVHHETHILPYPRYQALYRKKSDRLANDRAPEWSKIFSTAERRDIQVWFQLTHFDADFRRHDPRLQELIRKGSGFSEKDKQVLRQAELELLARVIPEYRLFWDHEQIEISTSPFFHPILPLLIDPGEGRTANPALPDADRLDFSWPEDAAAQLNGALGFMESKFGRRPTGIWPSEGALSEKVIRLLDGLGVSWTAADEINLGRSLATPLARDGQLNLIQPQLLYKPYQLENTRTRIFFRDHFLSDLIGFFYQKVPAEEAAADLVRRIKAIPHGQDFTPLVSLILDGENAWEFYPDSGRHFLRRFYELLSTDTEIETVRFGDLGAVECGRLQHYHPGSWINGNFDIWIGNEDDRQAWTLLRDAHRAVDGRRSSLADPGQLQAVSERIHAAQGSDWFWWYGSENFTSEIATFDRLFRDNLQAIYHALGLDVPDRLLQPIVDPERVPELKVTLPGARLRPLIDGRESDFFEWGDAGRAKPQFQGGAINPARVITREILFGFGDGRLFLRIDSEKEAAEYFANGFSLDLQLQTARGKTTLQINGHPDRHYRFEPECPGAAVAVDRIIEIAIPTECLGFLNGDEFTISLQWLLDGTLFQQFPVDTILRLPYPAERHYISQWQV